MKKVTQKTTWKTEDGFEFYNKIDAEAHELFIEAEREYKAAQRRFQEVLAGQFETADGFTFEIMISREYYYVFRPCGSMPRLLSVHFYARNWAIDHQQARKDTLSIINYIDAWGNESKNGVHYNINELYLRRENALPVLKQAQREWLEEQQRIVNLPGD